MRWREFALTVLLVSAGFGICDLIARLSGLPLNPVTTYLGSWAEHSYYMACGVLTVFISRWREAQ